MGFGARFFVLALLAATVGCAPAGAAVIPATPANLAQKIAAARPGDVVAPQPGRYPPLVLRDVKKASPGVTIRPAPGAILGGVKLTQVSGLTLADCVVESTGQPKYAIEIRDFQDIAVQDCEIRGPIVEKTGFNEVSQGVLAKGGKGLRLSRNNIHDLKIAIGYAMAEDVRIEDNHIHDISGDAVRGCGWNVRIRGNRATNLFLWDDDHLDFLQFSTVWCERQPGRDITIEDNQFRRGRGHQAQGLFMRGNPIAGWKNVVIRGNGFVGTNHNGIFVSFADGVVIEDNFVQRDTASNGTRIGVADSANVQVNGNVMSRDKLVVGRLNGFDERGNRFNIPGAEPGDYRALDAWLRRKERRPPQARGSRD